VVVVLSQLETSTVCKGFLPPFSFNLCVLIVVNVILAGDGFDDFVYHSYTYRKAVAVFGENPFDHVETGFDVLGVAYAASAGDVNNGVFFCSTV
jgi:hypothetical protein